MGYTIILYLRISGDRSFSSFVITFWTLQSCFKEKEFFGKTNLSVESRNIERRFADKIFFQRPWVFLNKEGSLFLRLRYHVFSKFLKTLVRDKNNG